MSNSKLTAYEVQPGGSEGWVMRPASRKREWMKANNSHAYKCLPLVVANHLGWVVECPVGFTVQWNGFEGWATSPNDPPAMTFQFDSEPDRWASQITAHFGNGILTFKLPWLFQTSEQVGMMVRGPTNHWKNGAHPLDGFVETWWLPFTFTMNWKMTQADTAVRFEQGEPICQLHTFRMETVSEVEPEVRSIQDNMKLVQEFQKWVQYRQLVNTNQAGNVDLAPYLNKYTRGENYSGDSDETHQKQVQVRPFVDKRKK